MNGATNPRPEVSFVLPVYNEAENIREMIERLRLTVPGSEIIVVDDNSPDGSGEIARSAGARVINGRGGLAAALSIGTASATGNVVIWMDSDLSMPPEESAKLLAAVRNGADVAVGSRYVKGGADRRPFIRVFTSRIINSFACVMLPVKIRDYDSGFVAARKEVLDAVPLLKSGYGEYCIEFLCMAGMKGFSIEELGYVFTDRVLGKSKSMKSFSSFLLLGTGYIRRVIDLRGRCRRMKKHGFQG